MDDKRAFRGVWIPSEVWLDKRLGALDKMILAEIDSLDTEEHGCFASNEYLSKFCQCSPRKISDSITKLLELQYVVVESFDGRNRVLRSRIEKSARQSSKICEADSQNLPHINIMDNTNTDRLSINIDNLVKAYNQLCPSLPAVQKLTNDRRAKLKSRLKTFDEDEIKACFILAEQSDFLSGRSGRWKANFDWLIKNDTTMQKVLEGAYANTVNEKNMSTEDRLKKALMEIQREMQDVRNSSY